MDKNDLLTHYAGQVKTLEGKDRIGGYLILFSDENAPDLVGDYFDRDTDFYGLEDGDKAVTLWHHGLDPSVQGPIGKGVLKVDDQGVWYESQLTARKGYEDRLADIMKLVSENKVGFSSGSPGHLVRREKVGESNRIKAWQIAEASLTVSPCEPRSYCVPLKSLLGPVEAKGKTLADHTIKITDELKTYIERIKDYAALKAEDDRRVSQNRRDSFMTLKGMLEDVITLSEPKPDPAIVAMKLRLMREKLSAPNR